MTRKEDNFYAKRITYIAAAAVFLGLTLPLACKNYFKSEPEKAQTSSHDLNSNSNSRDAEEGLPSIVEGEAEK